MKFLVDAQLPKALVDLLKYKGFDAIHTKELPNANLTEDKEIRNRNKIKYPFQNTNTLISSIFVNF